MIKTHTIIFFDTRGSFGPMTELRHLAQWRVGALRVDQRLAHQRNIPIDDIYINTCPDRAPDHDHVLLANARQWYNWPIDLHFNQAILDQKNDLVAAHCDIATAKTILATNSTQCPNTLQPLSNRLPPMISRPCHLIERLESILKHDLINITTNWPTHTHTTPHTHIHPTANLSPHIALITDNGPIVIDQHANLSPFCVIHGPCYIGPHTLVAPHTQLRGPISVGPSCVVGGEISHTAIDSYSNKSHAGYLGHAIVGQWVNLGANTNASNLKNTYGPIRVQLTPTQPNPENTGMTKLGPLIGDHVRTAISTRITTGTCIGTASMIATSVFCPKYVPPLTFLTDQGPAPYDPDRLLQNIDRMMQRRQQSLNPQQRQRLQQPFYPTTSSNSLQ